MRSQSFRFAGLHQLLWPVLDRADELPGVQGAALRGAFGLTAERVEDRFLVSVALLGLLTTVAEDGPLLCVFDDAHWLDQPSADALRFSAVRHQLVEVTHGNPLALLELPRGLTDDQRAGRTPLIGDVTRTAEFEQAFLAQIRPLPEATQRLLLLAAADDSAEIGTVLGAAERLGLPVGALDAAERARLLTLDGRRLRFRHPLVRSAVYRAATSSERREAHETLAAMFAGERDADRHAWHRAAAAIAPDEQAAAELERTADAARERGGHAAAARA
jgi:hypothetical protein